MRERVRERTDNLETLGLGSKFKWCDVCRDGEGIQETLLRDRVEALGAAAVVAEPDIVTGTSDVRDNRWTMELTRTSETRSAYSSRWQPASYRCSR